MYHAGKRVTQKMSNCMEEEAARSSGDDEHLGEVPDGAGCTEIWETLSERRDDE